MSRTQGSGGRTRSKRDELYETAIREFGRALDRLTTGYEADPEKRHDLRQDIHFQLWRSLEAFDGRCALKTWAFRVAHNTAVSYVNRERRKSAGLVSLEEIERTAPSDEREPDIDQQRAFQRLAGSIRQLKPLDRQIMMSYLEEMDTAAIAEITGLSPANVGMKIHRIKNILPTAFSRRNAMSDQTGAKDPGAIWRDQPEEKVVNLEQIVKRRTEELYSSTRAEILMSIGAALLFVGVMAWRFAPAHEPLQELGYAAVITWVALTLYRFRHQIWPRDLSRPDMAAATGLAYYREELKRRRDHLRNAWLWHGPLVLACMILVATLAQKAFPGFERLRNALPLIILLVVWTGFGFSRRRRRARELQREIDEMEAL